jgi:TRAP-type transport system periplasmic protein
VISVYFPQEMVGYGIADLPIENPDSWVGMRATDALMRNNDSLREDLDRRGLVYLGTYTTSAVQMGCKDRTVASIDEIEGLRIRGVGAYGQAFRDLGANLVNMSVYEAYQGLDTGLIDCTQTYSYLIQALRFDEVFDSYTMIDWGQIGALGILMNRDAFNQLNDEQQEVLMTAGAGMADEFGRIITEANEAAIEVLRDQGKEIVRLSDEDRARLAETGTPYIEEWIERANAAGLDGQALIDEYRDLIAHYTEMRDDEGYPWERELN